MNWIPPFQWVHLFLDIVLRGLPIKIWNLDTTLRIVYGMYFRFIAVSLSQQTENDGNMKYRYTVMYHYTHYPYRGQ